MSSSLDRKSDVLNPSISATPISLDGPNHVATRLKRLRNPMEFDTAEEYERLYKRSGLSGQPGKFHGFPSGSPRDLPTECIMTLDQGSAVKSMDFHPLYLEQILLLVGTITGDVLVWKLGNRERIAKNFKVWDLGACSVGLQASLADDYTASVNRVMWSPDGALFGVAYSKHIVHIYSYHGGDDIRNHLEIEAHVGSVNDLAFSYPNKQLCLVTCGEDKVIKVWDAVTGSKKFTFEGHEAPVYSVCPHDEETVQFILSTATDGKIKAWLYDTMGSRIDFHAPRHSSTTMAYSRDGMRLLSCGTNKDGKSHLVEWNINSGKVKQRYTGLGKRSVGVVQFDTTRFQILAAGDECMVKFWDMNNFSLLYQYKTDADGGLPASPCIRFLKDGMLLAVSTNDNCVKILANGRGISLVHKVGHWELDAFDPAIKARLMGNVAAPPAPVPPMIIGKPRISDELVEINEPSQCRSLRLDHKLAEVRVARLMYVKDGMGIFALASNGVHKGWGWVRNSRNSTGMATARVAPSQCLPLFGVLMMNENPDEDAAPCSALSKKDKFLMSASGGKISLYSMTTAETIATLAAPPPAATFIAFHPQHDKIIAIGMDDSSIQVYNFGAPRNSYETPSLSQVENKLTGHRGRITGLAFSNALNILVSSGADSQLCVWNIDGWEKQVSKMLQIPSGHRASDTRVQFHIDQTHLLAVHKTQIALYEAPKLECLGQWFPPREGNPITDATYSCDSQSIYVCFEDGSVGVITAQHLTLRCTIGSSAYLPTPNPRLRVYPVVIAAHPSEPNQFSLGLTDGGVYVVEPLESEGKWGTSPPAENGAAPSTSGAVGSEQQAQ
ncbi:Topless-related protein 4 [Linum grandiflorum]